MSREFLMLRSSKSLSDDRRHSNCSRSCVNVLLQLRLRASSIGAS